MSRMAEAWVEQDDSGADDCAAWQFEQERRRFDEEQEILRADPAFFEWLESLNAESTKEYESGYYCI